MLDQAEPGRLLRIRGEGMTDDGQSGCGCLIALLFVGLMLLFWRSEVPVQDSRVDALTRRVERIEQRLGVDYDSPEQNR